jgi:hypothetical protein
MTICKCLKNIFEKTNLRGQYRWGEYEWKWIAISSKQLKVQQQLHKIWKSKAKVKHSINRQDQPK